MRIVFWIGVSQTTWCIERCFSAITGHVIKQDGSSPISKPQTADGLSEHKNPCEAKIKPCVIRPATSQFNCFYCSSISATNQDNTITNNKFQAFITYSRSGMLECVPEGVSYITFLTFMVVAQLPTHYSSIQGVPSSSITDSPPHSIATHLHSPLCPVSPSSQTNVTIIAWWV